MAHEAPVPDASRRVAQLNAQSWDVSQSNPRAALRFAEEARADAEAAGDDAGLAEARLNAGWALIYLGRYDDAVGAVTDSREGYLRMADEEGVNKATNALGVISFRVGETERARELFENALRMADRAPTHERRIASLNNLGELHAAVGNYADALQHYERALELAAELDNEGILATVEVNIARIQIERGDEEQALDGLDRALARAASAGDRIIEAEALSQLGRATLRRNGGKDPDGEAEALHYQSIELCEEIGHPSGVIASLESLVELLLSAGRLDEAEEHARRAVSIARETDAQITAMELVERLADLRAQSGDVEAAYLLGRWLLELQREHAGADAARRLRTLEARHELDQARMEAEIVRLRNVELREKSDELARRNRTLQLMYRIGSELTAAMELDEIARRLHDRVNELMSADVFGVAFFEEQDASLDFAVVIEDNQRLTPFVLPVSSKESFATWVVRNREEICLNNAEKEYSRYIERPKRFTAGKSRSIVYLPLELEGRIIGVLTVQSYRRNAYDDERMAVLRLLVPYIAVAMDNARKLRTIRELNETLEGEKKELERAYGRIEHLANHDILTGLPNRRLLVELIHEHIPLARRQEQMFALLYVDIDSFKPVNDAYGHEMGDQVLVRLADRLRAAVRQSDTVARIGGDEFVLVLRDVGSAQEARAIAAKVLAGIAQPLSIGELIATLTASIGVSLFPSHGESYNELLVAADQAMYRAKEDGKSGVVLATESAYRGRTSTLEESIESPSNANRPST
jgi:diguanylate cyclase (GGDEF)-like protein